MTAPVVSSRDVLPLSFAKPVVGFAIGGIVLVNVLNAYAIVAGPREGGLRWFLLEGESNPGTWLSSSLLLIGSVLAWTCRHVDCGQRVPFWSVISAALLVMSIDEVIAFHERVGGGLGDSAGDERAFAYLWVVPVAAAAALVLGWLWRLRPQLPVRTRRQLLVGAALTLGGAIALELVPVFVTDGPWWDTEVLLATTVEENLELVGTVIVIRALLAHLVDISGSSTLPARDNAA